MTGDFIKVGRLGRPHGLKGELKITIEDDYLDALLIAESILVSISGQPIPYFVEAWRSDGLLIKLEEVDDKETASLLQQKDVYFPTQLLPKSPVSTGVTPYDHWVGYTITDEAVGKIGVIEAVIDLPQHYLAEVKYNEKVVMIPLHENLIISPDDQAKSIMMSLPEGLLDL